MTRGSRCTHLRVYELIEEVYDNSGTPGWRLEGRGSFCEACGILVSNPHSDRLLGIPEAKRHT